MQHHQTECQDAPGRNDIAPSDWLAAHSGEASLSDDSQRAVLNILEDFAAERTDLEYGQRAMLNILEDFEFDKAEMESAQRAMLNILDDSASEKYQLEAAERAVVNILDDFAEEKTRLEMVQSAAINILEDFEEQRAKVEVMNRHLQLEVEERKRIEESLHNYSSELARSNADLQQFAYVASHDLQEPLRSIGGFAQMLSRRYRGKLDSDADEFIDFITDGVARMKVLIGDLLAFSRVGTRANPLASVDCTAVLGIAEENLRLAIEDNHAVITHGPLPTVQADQTQLTQLFQNLLGNAIKFRNPESDPRVHVTVVRQGQAWKFSFADNGIGIDPKYFERIFVIFQRLHTRDKYPGTGVGLAICKRIVERHGGQIWVQSEAGRGTTFFFSIADELRTK